MYLNENYNSAKQKYGQEITDVLSRLGLPPQYLLAACRYIVETKLNPENIVRQFRDWMKYVIKYEKCNVNCLSYEQFINKIKEYKIQHILPNVIWYNSQCSIGTIDLLKDARIIPVENVWCIKAKRKFYEYIKIGYKFFLIFSPNIPEPFTYIIAGIHEGEVDYWDMRNYRYSESFQNNEHQNIESMLPIEIKNILYNESANQTENKNLNCNRIMKTKKKVIRLTESNLRSIIAESVKKVLNETTQSIWRNVPNTQFMYHGEWSDPEIIYKGHELNANDVEDYIYDIYKEECEYNSVTPSEDDYEEWIKEQGVSWLKSILDNLI